MTRRGSGIGDRGSGLAVLLFLAACGGEDPQTFLATVAVGDTVRSFVLFVPPAEARTPGGTPLLIVFHGSSSSGAAMQAIGGLDARALAAGMVVAYPDAPLGNWAEDCGCNNADRLAVNDTGFVSALIDSLAGPFSIDRSRVYAAGLSQGGLFVHRLACQMPDRIAAVASVVAPISAPLAARCAPADPVGVLVLMGTDDATFPFTGGGTGDRAVLGAQATVDLWRGLNGCTDPPETTSDGPLTTDRWAACAGGTEVALVTATGGTHAWQPVRSGPSTAEVILPFLLRHRR